MLNGNASLTSSKTGKNSSAKIFDLLSGKTDTLSEVGWPLG